MDFTTLRIQEKIKLKYNAFKERINPELIKHSQEYYVLATLKSYMPELCKEMVSGESPDLQNDVLKYGIEVTTASIPNDMQLSREYTNYCRETSDKRKNEIKKKIEDLGGRIERTAMGECLSQSGGGLPVKEKEAFINVLQKKNKKAIRYREKYQRLGLAIFFQEILSSECEKNCIQWIKEGGTLIYDDYYLISHRFFICLNNQCEIKKKISITSDENFQYQVIARMTAEGDIDLQSPEWN